MKEIYELRVERRLRALGVFRVLCEYSFQEDLYASHKEILDCLFNVYCNGLTNDDVVQKVSNKEEIQTYSLAFPCN